MAIVALFLFICHSGSFSLKQSWWLYNSLMTITLLKAVVALFLFNGYSSYIPVKLALVALLLVNSRGGSLPVKWP
jgi:hypothetical protein